MFERKRLKEGIGFFWKPLVPGDKVIKKKPKTNNQQLTTKHDSCLEPLRVGGLEYDVVGMGLHVLVTSRLNLPL